MLGRAPAAACQVGLASYLEEGGVWGQDAPELKACGFVKAALIAQVLQQRGWQPHQAS